MGLPLRIPNIKLFLSQIGTLCCCKRFDLLSEMIPQHLPLLSHSTSHLRPCLTLQWGKNSPGWETLISASPQSYCTCTLWALSCCDLARGANTSTCSHLQPFSVLPSHVRTLLPQIPLSLASSISSLGVITVSVNKYQGGLIINKSFSDPILSSFIYCLISLFYFSTNLPKGVATLTTVYLCYILSSLHHLA